MPNYVGGVGPLEPDLMAIGESPGAQENLAGIPFVGPSGEMINDCFRKANIRRSEVYITNVVKYQPPYNDFTKLHLINVDLAESIKSLWDDEISQRKPKCILAIGDEALQATTGYSGIINYRGSILLAKDGVTKVVPTIHPAALFNRGDKGGLEYTYLKLIEHDINRAVEESKTRILSLPDRQLDICHNSLDLYRFFAKYKDIREFDKATIDIESINCVPVCVGFAFSRSHAISIPLLRQIGQHKLTDMGDYELDEVWRLIDVQLRRLRLIGQNIKYDEFKLGRIGFELPNIYSDTLIKTRVIFPEMPKKRLNDQSSLWTREPYYKEEGKEEKIGKKFDVERFFKYNARDCAVTYEIDEEQEKDLIELGDTYNVDLKSYYYDYMMKKHKFYLKMENNGFRVDAARQKELRKTYTELALVQHQRVSELVGHEVNVNSYPQMFMLLYKEMKLKAMKRNPTSEDTIVALLGNHAKTKEKKEILTTILEERRIRTQKSRYINFSPDYDGRCKSSFNISATETCRSSTSILKKPIRPKKIGLAFHTISKHGRLAKDIRSMFIPDKGTVFLSADSSQAEARVVAVLSEDWELLKAFDQIDLHRRTAGLLFGYTQRLILDPIHVPVVDILEKDGPERFTGKMVRHASNYSMGKNRLMVEFNTNAQKYDIAMSISEWRASQYLELFHAASPKIKSKFHKDIQDCIDNSRTIVDPFGGIRVFNGRMDDELYKEAYANIPQRTVAHLVQGAALKISDEIGDNKSVMFLTENHDSLCIQVPENNWEPYAQLMKKHMEFPIDFRVNCSLKRDCTLVIPAEVEISDTNYADFRKVKM